MRHAVFAERLAPILANDQAIAAQRIDGLPLEQKAAAARERIEAMARIKAITAALYPDGDD